MDYISMILLVIVLVAQIVLFALFFWGKRRDVQRYSALLQYIDRCIEDADYREEIQKNVDDVLDAFGEKINERFKQQSEVIREFQQTVTGKIETLSVDYTEAQQAANKVNDFASSLASIFDYDPIRAIQKGRKKEAK